MAWVVSGDGTIYDDGSGSGGGTVGVSDQGSSQQQQKPYVPPITAPANGGAYGGGSSYGGSTGGGGYGAQGFDLSGVVSPGYTPAVKAMFEGVYGDPATAYQAWLIQNQGGTQAAAQDFTGQYGAGQSGLTTFQIWLQQQVRSGAMTAAQAIGYGLPQTALTSGGASGPTTSGPVNTIDGPLTLAQMQQKLGALGNPDVANRAYSITDPTALASYYNTVAQQAKQAAQDNADKLQRDALAQQAKNSGETDLIKSLIPILSGNYGPGGLTEINALLSQLGLPQIPGGGGSGADVNPLNLTPAQWDSLPNNVQDTILKAWAARGGDTKSFLAAIDRQRPGYGGGSVSATSGPQAGGNTIFARPS